MNRFNDTAFGLEFGKIPEEQIAESVKKSSKALAAGKMLTRKRATAGRYAYRGGIFGFRPEDARNEPIAENMSLPIQTKVEIVKSRASRCLVCLGTRAGSFSVLKQLFTENNKRSTPEYTPRFLKKS